MRARIWTFDAVGLEVGFYGGVEAVEELGGEVLVAEDGAAFVEAQEGGGLGGFAGDETYCPDEVFRGFAVAELAEDLGGVHDGDEVVEEGDVDGEQAFNRGLG